MGNTVKRENYNYNRNQPKDKPNYNLYPFPNPNLNIKEGYGCDTYPEACFSEPRAPTPQERKVWEGVL